MKQEPGATPVGRPPREAMNMPGIPIYIVDAFTDTRFRGNPAAVCVLDAWLDDAILQAIAAENNLSETAFLVARDAHSYEIRWFTPKVEVDLCGHATLASAHALVRHRGFSAGEVRFESRRSGVLPVRIEGELYVLDFPVWPATPVEFPAALVKGFGRKPSEVRVNCDMLAVFEKESDVRALVPDLAELAKIDVRGVIVTAPGGDGVDFVSRFFAPRAGIDEDPVTGSAHCTLAPFWGTRLGKSRLSAQQVSKRGGDLVCTLAGDRVHIAGRAVTHLVGEITI